MTNYNPNIPQPRDLPSDSQSDFDTNFLSLNEVFGEDHVPFGNIIEAATIAAPIVITSTTHRLTTGNSVTVFNMEGTNDVGVREDWPINGTTFTVTVIDDNTFSLDGSDSTTFPTYLANSGDFSSISIPYGNHTKNFFPSPQLNPPNRASPKSAYFSQEVVNENSLNQTELFFQNGETLADIVQLTNIPSSPIVQYRNLAGVSIGNGRGFITPWGTIVNFGNAQVLRGLFTTLNYAIPYTSQVFSFTMTRGPVRATNTFQENPIGQSLSNTQFRMSISSTSNLSSVIARVSFISLGV